MLNTVISAVQTLHGHASQNEKKQADVFLRNWQTSIEAWQQADEILRMTDLPVEVHYQAAITLRSKVMSDFIELPISSHMSLCDSLFSHINAFKFASTQAILRYLVYALADMTIYTIGTWNNPVETFVSKFSNPTIDSMTLVLCLKALAEENMNPRVLVDHEMRQKHNEMLKSNAKEVLRQMDLLKFNILKLSYVETYEKLLNCYVQWIKFINDENMENYVVNLAIDCYHIIGITHNYAGILEEVHDDDKHTDLTKLCKSSMNCSDRLRRISIFTLTELYRICGIEVAESQPLLSISIKNLNGTIKTFMTEKLKTDNPYDCLGFSKVYQVFMSQLLKTRLYRMLGESPELQELLGTMMMVTATPFSLDDVELGAQGIVAVVIEFWYSYISAVNGYKDEGVYHKRIIQQLLVILMQQLLIPPCLLDQTNSSEDLNDFHDFRKEIMNLFMELHMVIGWPYVLEQVFQEIRSIGMNMLETMLIKQEAMLTLLAYIISEIPHRIISDFANNILELIRELLPLCDMSILSSNVISLMHRVSVLTLIDDYVKHKQLDMCEGMIKTLLDMFSKHLLLSYQYQETQQSKEDSHLLTCLYSSLSALSAIGVRDLCWYHSDNNEVHSIVEDLVVGCQSNLLNLSDSSYLTLIEGLGIVLVDIKDDSIFVKCLEKICNFMMERIKNGDNGVVEKDNYHELSGGMASTKNHATWMNRLAILTKSLSNMRAANRKEIFGVFVVNQLWPLVYEIMRIYRDCKVLIERCGRVLKHAKKCCPDQFRLIVPQLISLIMDNATYRLYATYFYMGEWLSVEYSKVFYQPLTQLFDLFSNLAISHIDMLQKNGVLPSHHEIVEDFFNLLSKYMTIAPRIIYNSSNFEKCLICMLPCFYQDNTEAANAVFGFLRVLTFAILGKEVLNDLPEEDKAEMGSLLEHSLIPIYYRNLDLILIEISRVIMNVPRNVVKKHICDYYNLLTQYCNIQIYRSSIEKSLKEYSVKIIPSDSMKQTIINDLTSSNKACVSKTVEDLYLRSYQLRWRKKDV